MPDALHGNHFNAVIHGVNNTIVSHADAKSILTALHFSATGGTRINSQFLHGLQDAALHRGIESPQILLRRPPETNGVERHAS